MKWSIRGDIAETDDGNMSSVNLKTHSCVFTYAKTICDLVAKENPKTILILGLSLGCMVAELARRTDAKITGVDIDPDSVKFVRAMVPSAKIYEADASSIRLGHFDVIISDIFSSTRGPYFPVDPKYVNSLIEKSTVYIQNVIYGVRDMRKMGGWDKEIKDGGNTIFVKVSLENGDKDLRKGKE